ncbi:hypothetical protein Pla52nx_004690 [Stieleria varia]|uniref:hypothetical protein n=1 Tax=Stieleria varia TaxID=2528005 RepID=UPI00313CAB51
MVASRRYGAAKEDDRTMRWTEATHRADEHGNHNGVARSTPPFAGRHMKGNDPAFVEAARLVKKFFPESTSFISEVGLDWDAFLGAMMTANYEADYSCCPFRNPTDPDLGLAQKGGLDGEEDEVYSRLLSHAEFTPSGRAVVILDAIGNEGWSTEQCPPFICASQAVPQRISEIACFGQSRDTIFVFESGESLLVDHDERVHWARSNVNQQWKKACEPSHAREPAVGPVSSGESSPPAP